MTDTHPAIFQSALKAAGVAKIAEELGVSEQNVRYWAGGARLVPFKRVEWLAKRLGLAPADIRPDMAKLFSRDATEAAAE